MVILLAGLIISATACTSGNTSSAVGAEASSVSAVNSESSAEADDNEEWKNNTGTIELGTTAKVTGDGVAANGSTITISKAGEYTVTGSCDDGTIIIDTDGDSRVQLRLNGISLNCSSGPAIVVNNAKKAYILCEDGTTNTITDTSTHTDDTQKGAIFSNDTLEFKGSGALNVTGNYGHGITCDDNIIFENGTISVIGTTDAIHANDDVTVRGTTNLTVKATSDGIESEGTLNISEEAVINADATAKGIKAATDFIIDGGEINVTSTDDCVHSNGTITINGGVFSLSTSGDAIHADSDLTVNGGDINVKEAEEGVESKTTVIINDGNLSINVSDDGINASSNITINGGKVYSHSTNGDGIDSNGSIDIAGGTIVAIGAQQPEDGIDCDNAEVNISGGILVACGGGNSGGSNSASQCSASIAGVSEGTVINISDGTSNIITFKASTSFSSLLFSCPSLKQGTEYTVSTGGTVNGGTDFNGLYTDAEYSGGTTASTFTQETVFTNAGGSIGMGGGGRGGMGNPRGDMGGEAPNFNGQIPNNM